MRKHDRIRSPRTAAVSAAVPGASRPRNRGQNTGATNVVSPPRFGSVEVRDRGRLPHWETEEAVYFVTFRLADSLPAHVVAAYEEERNRFTARAREKGRKLSVREKQRIAELFSEKIDGYLDSGTGACQLAQRDVAEVVSEALRKFDGVRYRLFAWCIMPNHVHVAFRALPGRSLADIVHSWKSFTAKQANRLLGKRGIFWQREYYDHIIRDEDELNRVAEYILGNPIKAGLSNWPWVWPVPDRIAAVPAAVPGASRPRQCRQDACDTAGEDAGDTRKDAP